MNIINWNNHTPDTFTEFCNALLVFEVSKSVKVFSAPGKDGGVDASYTGQYGENSGDWRFQYKFHRVSRKQGYYSLKSELSSEIQKIKNEDNFVFITNVELLPQEQLELEKLFESEKGDISPKTKFFIWDGAKLQTLLIGHPLLIYWLEEGFETAQLQSFETYFRKGIETNNFAPNTLSNIFIGRKKVFADLEKCLDLKKNIILIQGEAGIGKTRLLIEFFKTLKTKNSMWRVLVLANKNVDFDKIKRALSDHHKYILMVDDAHSYDGKDISDLLKISEATNGRVKLFLTARSIQASTSLQHIREYDQDEILTINLSTLERAETQAALEPYLKQTSYFHHIGELIQITYGRPILIVAVLRAIQDRTRIETIRETNFLKTYVNNYFNEFHNEFQKLTGTSNLRSKRLLQNIALIEPFNFDDSNIINKLVEIHELHHTEITTALKLLKNYSFVSGRYEQSIKPDYYSDIVLQDISVQEASNHIMDFGAQLDNIVVNLSSVDEIGDDKSALLDDILKTYVGWIDKIEDNEGISNERKISTISRILHTVARIVYVKPKIARKAIEFYLKNFLIPGHPVNLEMASNGNFNYVPTDALIHKVATILSRLFLIPEYFGFVYDTSLMLFEMSNEKTIVPIFNFGKRDLIENYGLTRQRYVLNRISKEIENINPLNFRFVKQIFKAMLNLEFTVTENSAVTRDALAITTYRLPNSESVKNLRENIIAILEISYERPQLSSEKLETLKLILDVPRGILSTHRNNRPYQNDNEIFRVLDFIERKGEYFTLLEQKETLDKLFWFTKWGIDEKFKDKIEEVKGKLKPKDLAEKLSQLFGSDQVAILRNSNIHSYVAEQCESIAREVPEQELALAMKKFLEPQPYQPHYFWEFLRHLEKNHISHAIRFHDLLMESASPLYYQYASSLLSTLRFSQDNTEMFWERVEKLQNLDYWEADNVILLAYGNKVPGTSFIEDRDVDVILKINDKNRHENDYALASGLQSIITANYPDVNNILGDYLDRVGQRDAEMFFIWLLDNKMANNELVRYLVVEKTIRFYLSYEIERGLAFVLKYFGPLEVFKYLVRRFEHKKMEVIATRSLMGYEFLPHGENTQLFDEAPELKLEMFKFALDWFLSTESAGGHLFYGKDMLVYLQPDQSITDDTYVLYIGKIEQLADSLENLEKIADTLSIFHNKNSLLFTLIARIYASGISLRKENQEMFNHLYFSLHSALTTVGVKSGQAGIPFQVDLDLKELILKEMDQLSEFDETRHLLKEVLANIENEINRNFDHDNETW